MTKQKDFQIGCNLGAMVAEQLEAYAAVCEVTRSKLLGLLVVRELNSARLKDLATRYTGSDDREEAGRVTGRMMTRERRDAFREHAREMGMTIEDGLARLARAEVDEKWLSKALNTAESELILTYDTDIVEQ